MKKNNIAFEISPFITASGSFGDKSGVYRYMLGLLNEFVKLTKKNKMNLVLFSFNESALKLPIAPEIFKLIDNKNIFLIDKRKDILLEKGLGLLIKKIFSIKSNSLFKLINKIFFIKFFLEDLKNRLKFNSYQKYLTKSLKKFKIKSIFHSETGFFKIGDFKNIIVVYDLTPIIFPEFHRRANRELQGRKLRFIQDFADGIVCISNHTKKDLLDNFKYLKSKKITVVYPGLDDVFFQSKLRQTYFEDIQTIIKNKAGKLEKKKYLLYYGTFEPRKNAIQLVKVFSDMQKEGKIPKKFKLIMSGGEGWGGVKKSIKNFINENYPIPSKNTIVLLNFLSDDYLISLIKNAYAIVYPSLYEGFGLPVLESMALGTPVICSNKSSMPEVGGNSVIYINPKDYFDLSKKILYLIKRPKIARKLSRRGIKQSKLFNWQISGKKAYNFIQALIQD